MWNEFMFAIDERQCAGPRRRGNWGGWNGWDAFGDFGGSQRRPHWRGGRRGGRMFEQGDLKYVILRLLDEKPRHGYEIIKELENRSGGSYAPSPGTVYPTLTMLEDLGFARIVQEESGKKIYEITDEGRQHLGEHRETVDDIFDRMARFISGFTDSPMMELNASFQRLAKATYRTATAHINDKEHVDRIREIIQRAADEIAAITK